MPAWELPDRSVPVGRRDAQQHSRPEPLADQGLVEAGYHCAGTDHEPGRSAAGERAVEDLGLAADLGRPDLADVVGDHGVAGGDGGAATGDKGLLDELLGRLAGREGHGRLGVEGSGHLDPGLPHHGRVTCRRRGWAAGLDVGVELVGEPGSMWGSTPQTGNESPTSRRSAR